jgi:hypothetical protein
MTRFSALLLSVFALLGQLCFGQNEPLAPIPGRLTDVTLYKGTALVGRHVELPADKQGTFEIVVSPLPTATDPDSVYADDTSGVEVRSVSCRTRPVDQAVEREDRVSQLDLAIRELERKISSSKNEIALRRIRQNFLKGLENFVAPAAHQEMTHGVLQAEELAAVTKMHFEEYESASQEILKLDFEIEDDQKSLSALKKERSKMATGPPQTYDGAQSRNLTWQSALPCYV